jgi:cytochrome c biogenesis factor
MARRPLLLAGITVIAGFAVSMSGCIAGAVVALIAALGITAGVSWFDYALTPVVIAILAGVAFVALRARRRGMLGNLGQRTTARCGGPAPLV